MTDTEPVRWLKQRYRLDRCLASGSDSRTWEVWDQTHQQTCILKELYLGQLEQWKRLELFQREARTLANLDHPQIPVLLDYFEDGSTQNTLCLVTEKAPGVTLDQKVSEGIGRSEEFCYLIAVQVLHILQYLHTRMPPVIHRDIKPSNLLLDDNGAIYLVDFGGVQELLRPAGSGGSTVIGTFGYMAPEQFSGRAVPQSDLYGLGATLIFLLSGLSPDQLPNPGLLIDFRPFVQCSERFANWIEQLILPALEQRFFSAAEALEVLQDILPVYARTLPLPALQKATAQAGLRLSPEQLSGAFHSEEALPAVTWALQPGAKLHERYTIEAVLAQGGHAVTYRGRVQDQPVIIKELHFSRLEHWKGYELFEREIRALQQLRHPRLPQLLDSFELNENQRHCFYLVTTLLPGVPLTQRIQAGWKPSEERVRDLAFQLLELLIELHEKEPCLIHRDLKPSNILIDAEQQLYLIDFGAVQDIFREKGGGGSTVIGTFGYMAPEQFLGQAGPGSDLYGLGATLLHVLSGRPPAEMLSPERPGLQFDEWVHCSPGLSWWLHKMVAPALEDRFGSARTAREALRNADSLSVLAAQPTTHPFAHDPAIELEQQADRLSFHLLPTYHDYKSLLLLLGGVNLTAFLMLLAVPVLGPVLSLTLLAASGGFLLYQRHQGLATHMRIEINTQGLRMEAWKDLAEGQQAVLEHMEIPLQSIESFALDHTMVHNRLLVKVRHSPHDLPMVCRSNLPLAHHRERAQYLIERLQAAVDICQRQRRRNSETPH